MRDFIFVMKSDENKKATVRTDIIDDKSENSQYCGWNLFLEQNLKRIFLGN